MSGCGGCSGAGGKRAVAGVDVEVAVSPCVGPKPGFLESVLGLLRGMKLTLGYFLRPSTVVTQQYPENRATLKMFDRFRGQLRLRHDEQGRMICNGCNFCELACPNRSIRIDAFKGPVTNKSELDRFTWRMDTCTFCSACVQACPHDALHFTGEFESAVYDKRLLAYSLNHYAGPAARFLAKADANPEELAKLKAGIQPRERFGGLVPLAGHSLPGSPASRGGKHE